MPLFWERKLSGNYLGYIQDMQAKIEAQILPTLDGKPISVLHYPDYRNPGDSAIWTGAMETFRRLGKTPAYVASRGAFRQDDLLNVAPEGTIYFTGGGTFGDVWEGWQEDRERLMKLWPNRPFVQLPQSIQFQSPQRLEQTARAIAAHKNYTLMVRDVRSKELAEKHFDCKVVLCPDTAFGIGPIKAPKPVMPLLAMLRDDREKQEDKHVPEGLPASEDWIFSTSNYAVKFAKATGAVRQLMLAKVLKMRAGSYNAAAQHRVDRGMKQIARAGVILTDRLHVHIVCVLLGRPHAVLDNSYGKIHGFINAFPGAMDITYLTSSLEEAAKWGKARAAELPIA